jgi:hypothetical protein
MNIVEVAYSLQSLVDDKHHLIVGYEVTNKNDMNALCVPSMGIFPYEDMD